MARKKAVSVPEEVIEKKPVACRQFCGLLYPDSETYDCDSVLSTIRGYFTRYAFILHDSDIEDDGTLKKPHYHWIGSFDNPRLKSVVCNRLEVAENYVGLINKKDGTYKSWPAAVQYLVHENLESKFQYSVDLCISNFSLDPFLSRSPPEVQIMKMVDFIYRAGPVCSVRDMVKFAVDHGCYSEFRRAYSLIKDLRSEKLAASLSLNGSLEEIRASLESPWVPVDENVQMKMEV